MSQTATEAPVTGNQALNGQAGSLANLPPGIFFDGRSLRCPTALLELHPHEAARGVNRNKEDFQDLAYSVARWGIKKPLNIMPSPESPGKFWVVDGLQRLTLANDCDFTDVPITFEDPSNVDHVGGALISAINQNMHVPMTRADAAIVISRLVDDDPSITNKRLAEKTGLTENYIKRTIQLGKLSPEAVALVDEGKISTTNAILLTTLPETDRPLFQEQAQTLTGEEFSILVTDRNKAHALAKQTGDKPKDPVFVPSTCPQKKEYYDEAIKNPLAVLTRLQSGGDDLSTPVAIVLATLNYAVKRDNLSLKEQEQAWNEKRAQIKAAAEARKAEREAAKTQETTAAINQLQSSSKV